jgi:predicted RNA-binding protein associated with RNAse of E/G family
MTQPIAVIKRNLTGEDTWRYTSLILRREPGALILPSRCCAEARFNRPDTPFQGILLKENARFVGTYFTDRWYNIYEIHDRDRIKGWYCSIGQPAILEADDRFSYVDLALDLWVTPDCQQVVLDEDAIVNLDLDPNTRSRAQKALEELRLRFR